MMFNLVKDKKLIFFRGQMMENGHTKDVVIAGEVFPNGFLGNVGFTEFVPGVGFDGFLEELSANIEAGVMNILRQAEKQAAVAATNVQKGRVGFNFG